jgi:RNA polymerase sigma-70 factor (ECF subfamily)
MRRARARRAEVGGDEAEGLPDPAPGAEDLIERRKARELLDRVLDSLEMELRAVFVLYELDGFTMAEIADALELAPGTVASRLRRAREQFETRVARLERSMRARGGGP